MPREIPKERPITIVVHLPKAEARLRAGRMFGDALHNRFAHRAENATNIAAGRLALAPLGDTEFAKVLQRTDHSWMDRELASNRNISVRVVAP